MTELKVYVPQDGPYGLEPEEGGEPVEEETCYLKSEVDKVVAEKDAEISELKENYRNLRRHLFNAGAKWAEQEKMRYTSNRMHKMAGAFENMERMCMEMMENLRKEQTQEKCTKYRKEWLARQSPEKQEQMREKNKERCKKWHAEHPEQAARAVRECSKRYYWRHRDEICARRRRAKDANDEA